MTEALTKVRALSYLVEHRRQTLRAPYSVEPHVTLGLMGRQLGLPLHDLKHVLYDLQKRDAIRFRERLKADRRGGASTRGDLDRFQVTRVGMAMLEDTPPAELEAATPPVTTGEPVNVAAFMANVTGREPAPPRAPLPPLPREVLALFDVRALRAALEGAAQLLEGAGMDDLAVMVLDRLPALSPGELAVLDYLEGAGMSPDDVPLTGGQDGTERNGTGH